LAVLAKALFSITRLL